MKRSAVLGATALALLVGALPASADDLYPPPPEPPLEVEASSVCIGDVPYLEWDARHLSERTGASSSEGLTVRFINPDGPDHVLTGQPMQGRTTWPGVVIEDGTIVDWPGGHWEGDDWVLGDEYDWAVPEVEVEFHASPSAILTVSYPLPSAECYGPDLPPAGPRDPGGNPPDVLGLTGAQTAGLLYGMAALLAIGTALVAWRRRSLG